MSIYKRGDIVYCIARKHTSRDDRFVLADVKQHAKDKERYSFNIECIWVSEYYNERESLLKVTDERAIGPFFPDEELVKKFDINPNIKYFYTDNDCILPSTNIQLIDTKLVLSCRGCSNFAPHAEANCKDNGFVCWSCRTSNAWKYASMLIG